MEEDLFVALQALNSDPVFYFGLAKKYLEKGEKEMTKKFLEEGIEAFEDEDDTKLKEEFNLDEEKISHIKKTID